MRQNRVRSEQRTSYMGVVSGTSRHGEASPYIRESKPHWSWTAYGEVMRLTLGSPTPQRGPRQTPLEKPDPKGDPRSEGGRGRQIRG